MKAAETVIADMGLGKVHPSALVAVLSKLIDAGQKLCLKGLAKRILVIMKERSRMLNLPLRGVAAFNQLLEQIGWRGWEDILS